MPEEKNKTFFVIGSLFVMGVSYWQRHKIISFINRVSPSGSDYKIPSTVKSASNKILLNVVHPKYKKLFTDFIIGVQDLGLDPLMTSSYRDFSKQQILKKADSRNASPGLSKHNYGLAIDLVIKKNGKIIADKNSSRSIWEKTGVPQLAARMGLSWGENFPGYPDAVHFEIPGISTANLQQLAFKQFNTSDPNRIQGNKVNIS